MTDLAISGTTLAMCSLAVLFFIFALILLFRRYINKHSEQIIAREKKTPNSSIATRNKYLTVNVFRWSNTFLNVGLTLAVALVFLAFSWTTYEEAPEYEDLGFEIEEVMVIPRTTPPPPPLPPPPPPVIEAVPDEEIDEEEEIEFMDQLVEETTEVAPPPTPVAKATPPPTPPPPVVEDDADIPFMLIEDKPMFQECKGIKRAEQEKCFTSHLMKYVYGEVAYPAIARENGIQGNVIVKFVIEKSGKVGVIEVLRSPSEVLSKETVRVMEKLKQDVTFIPGMQRKRPVRVQFTMPVMYKLN